MKYFAWHSQSRPNILQRTLQIHQIIELFQQSTKATSRTIDNKTAFQSFFHC